jgi:hypothetical protein
LYLVDFLSQLKAEKEKYHQQKLALEKEKDAVYRLVSRGGSSRDFFRMKYVFSLQMTEQARESEHTRRKLERARQEVFHHMTRIKSEKESLEREVRNGRRGSN